MAFFLRAISGSERNKNRRNDTENALRAFQLELDSIRRRVEAGDEELHSMLEMIYDSSFPESQKFLKEPTKERLKAHTATVCRLLSGLSSQGVPVTHLLLQVATKYGTEPVSEPLITLLEMVQPLLANKDIPDFTSDDLLDAIDIQWHSGSVRSSPVWGTASSRTQSPAHSASTAVSPRSPAFRKVISSLSVPITKVEGNSHDFLGANLSSSPTNMTAETPPTPPMLQSLSDRNLTAYPRRSLAWRLGTESASQSNGQSNAEPSARINATESTSEVLQSPEDEEEQGLGETLSLPNSSNGGVKLLPPVEEVEEQEESTEIPVLVPQVDASYLVSSPPHFAPLDPAVLSTDDDGEVHEAKQENSFHQDFTTVVPEGGLVPKECTKMSQTLEGSEEELEKYGLPNSAIGNLQAASEVSNDPDGMVQDEHRSPEHPVHSELTEGEPDEPKVPASISGPETNLQGAVSDTSSQGSDANAKSSKEMRSLLEEPSSSSEESSRNLDEFISTPYESSSNSEESSSSLDELISSSYESSSHSEESSSSLNSTSSRNSFKATQETAMSSEGTFEMPATVVSPMENWKYELHNVPLNLIPTVDVEKETDYLVHSKILHSLCNSEDGDVLPVISTDNGNFSDVAPEFNNQLDLLNGQEALQKVNAVETENGKAHVEMGVETLPFSGAHDAVEHAAEVLNNGSNSQAKPTSGNELAAQLSVRFGTKEDSCKGIEQSQELHDSTSVKDEVDEDNPLSACTISPEQIQNHFEDSADIMSPSVEEVSQQEPSINGTENTGMENVPEVEMEIAGLERSTTCKNSDMEERASLEDEMEPPFSSEDFTPPVSLQTVNAEGLLSCISSGQEPGAGDNEAMVFSADAEDRGSLSSLDSGENQQTDENNDVSQGVKDGDELLPFAYFLPVQEGVSEGKSGTSNIRRLNEVVANNSTVKADDHNMSKGDMQVRNGFLHMSSTTPPHLQDGQHHMESKCLSLQLRPLQQLPSKVILPSNTGHVIIASIDDIMENVQAKPVEYDSPGATKVGLELPLAEWQGDNLVDKNNLRTLLSPDSVLPQYEAFSVDQCKHSGETNEQLLQQAACTREDPSNVSDIEEVHMSVPQRNMDNLLKSRETCEVNSPVTDDNLNNSTGIQEVESKVQDDEGSQEFQPPGRITDLETTKVLDVASEPVSVLGGAQEADQQAEDAVMPQVDVLENQEVESKVQEDEGARVIEPHGRKTDLETTKVLGVASEPVSMLGGAQGPDQQAEDVVMPKVDGLENQEVESKVHEDHGARGIQPHGRKTALETTKVLDVASEPVSILGGAQDPDQHAEDVVMPKVDGLENQEVESKLQEDEGARVIQPRGGKKDLETTKVLDVAPEPVSTLGGAQEADQQAEDAVMPQVDVLEKQEVLSNVQEDEGSREFQPPGRKAVLENTKVLDVASEPVSTLRGAQEAEQQAEDAIMPQVDVLDKQEVESNVQEDEGPREFQHLGRKADLETTKVLDVASEPVSTLGGAQEADQQAEDAVMPQVDVLNKQEVESKVQEDEGSQGFQRLGKNTDLETTEVLHVASELHSTLGGAQEADQQAQDVVMPQVDVLDKQEVESTVQEDEGSRGFQLPPERKTDLETTRVPDVASEPDSILGGGQKADQQAEESSCNSQPTVSMSSAQEDKQVQGLLASKPANQNTANLHSTQLNGRGEESVQDETKTIPCSDSIFAKSPHEAETSKARHQAEMPSFSGEVETDQSGFQKPLKNGEMTLINVAASALASNSISFNQSSPPLSTGNISYRSNSSTASGCSFAFPVSSTEYNVSPKKMALPDRRHFLQHKQKWRRWCCCCFCPSAL